jgi:hypothetical protein
MEVGPSRLSNLAQGRLLTQNGLLLYSELRAISSDDRAKRHFGGCRFYFSGYRRAPHEIRITTGIVAVGLVDLRLQNRPHVPRLDADHRCKLMFTLHPL